MADPLAQPGQTVVNAWSRQARVTIVYAITNVPDDLPAADLCRLATHTVMLRSFGVGDKSADACTYDFAELGVGKVVR